MVPEAVTKVATITDVGDELLAEASTTSNQPDISTEGAVSQDTKAAEEGEGGREEAEHASGSQETGGSRPKKKSKLRKKKIKTKRKKKTKKRKTKKRKTKKRKTKKRRTKHRRF